MSYLVQEVLSGFGTSKTRWCCPQTFVNSYIHKYGLIFPLIDQQYFSKEPGNKYFRCCRPYDFCHNYSHLPLSCENSRRWHRRKRPWRCSNKILFMDPEIWISCYFHESRNILLLFSPQLFKNVTPSVALSLDENMCPGRNRPAGGGLLT